MPSALRQNAARGFSQPVSPPPLQPLLMLLLLLLLLLLLQLLWRSGAA
jgi:hypothetical protein